MTPETMVDQFFADSPRAQRCWDEDPWYQMNLRMVMAIANTLRWTMLGEHIDEVVVDRVIRTVLYPALDPGQSEHHREVAHRMIEDLKRHPPKITVEELQRLGRKPEVSGGPGLASGVVESKYLAWYAERGMLWLWKTPEGEDYHVTVQPVPESGSPIAFACLVKAPDFGELIQVMSLAPESLDIRLCPNCSIVVKALIARQGKPLRHPSTTDVPERVPWSEVLDMLGESRLLWLEHPGLPRVLHIEYGRLSRREPDGSATDCGLADYHPATVSVVASGDERITRVTGQQSDWHRFDELVYVCTRCVRTLRGG